MFARIALACILLIFGAGYALALTPAALVGSVAATANSTTAPKPDQSDDSACKSEECDPGAPYTGNDPPPPSDGEGVDASSSEDERQD